MGKKNDDIACIQCTKYETQIKKFNKWRNESATPFLWQLGIWEVVTEDQKLQPDLKDDQKLVITDKRIHLITIIVLVLSIKFWWVLLRSIVNSRIIIRTRKIIKRKWLHNHKGLMSSKMMDIWIKDSLTYAFTQYDWYTE